jgi:hypothetical protein
VAPGLGGADAVRPLLDGTFTDAGRFISLLLSFAAAHA